MAASDLPARDRLRQLEQRRDALQAKVEQLGRAAQPANRRDVRLARTVKPPSGGSYPSQASCPNTYWIVFVDAEYEAETQGEVARTLTLRQQSDQARTTVQNVVDGKDAYIAEGQLIEVWHARGQWWTDFGHGACVFAEDDFSDDLSAWTQEAGSWSIDSGAVETSSDDALLIHDQEATEEAVIVDVDFFRALGGSIGAQGKVIIGWTDANNYTYALVHMNGFDGLELRQVSGGTDTQLLQRDVTLIPGTWYHLRLCYDGSKLRALVTSQDQTKHWRPGVVSATLGSGRGVGVGTGSLDPLGEGLGKEFTFDNFTAAREEQNQPNCEDCGPEICSCDTCRYNEGPKRWKIQIDGFSGSTLCGAVPCSQLDGTYFLFVPCDPELSCDAGPSDFDTNDGPGCFASGMGIDVCDCSTGWTIEITLRANQLLPDGSGPSNYIMVTILQRDGTCPDALGNPNAQPTSTGLGWRWLKEFNDPSAFIQGGLWDCFNLQEHEIPAYTADPDKDCDDTPALGTVAEWAAMCDHTTSTLKIWALAD